MQTTNNSNKESYIGIDIAGYPFNRKYPPDIKKYGSQYYGYKNVQRQTFFYDFAVLRYDVKFSYKGVSYYIIIRNVYCAQTDETLHIEYQRFFDAINLVESMKIDDKNLIDIIDLIEDVEVM